MFAVFDVDRPDTYMESGNQLIRCLRNLSKILLYRTETIMITLQQHSITACKDLSMAYITKKPSTSFIEIRISGYAMFANLSKSMF